MVFLFYLDFCICWMVDILGLVIICWVWGIVEGMVVEVVGGDDILFGFWILGND